jgi:uncharacterized SAM-binding protein YcdF (DUF218 family)
MTGRYRAAGRRPGGPPHDVPMTRRQGQGRRRGPLSTAALVALAMAVVATGVLAGVARRRFVDPPWVHRAAPAPADAVAMFGGGGPRFPMAVGLVEDGVAGTLMVSDPNDPAAGAGRTMFEVFCDGAHPYEALCFDPAPRTTRGEARAVAAMARERGWQRVVLVTTTEQAARARMLLRRCWDGDIDVVVVADDRGTAFAVLYETAATLRALGLRRGC